MYHIKTKLYLELSDNVLRPGCNYIYIYICIDRLSGPPKLKQDGDSGEEEEVANKVKHIVGFEAFTVNNCVRQSGVMVLLNITACRDRLYLRQSQKF